MIIECRKLDQNGYPSTKELQKCIAQLNKFMVQRDPKNQMIYYYKEIVRNNFVFDNAYIDHSDLKITELEYLINESCFSDNPSAYASSPYRMCNKCLNIAFNSSLFSCDINNYDICIKYLETVISTIEKFRSVSATYLKLLIDIKLHNKIYKDRGVNMETIIERLSL